MKIVISQLIFKKQGFYEHVYKKHTSDIKPCIGDKLSDSLWKDGENEVIEVHIDYNKSEIFVVMEPLEVDSEEHGKELAYAAKLHGWGALS